MLPPDMKLLRRLREVMRSARLAPAGSGAALHLVPLLLLPAVLADAADVPEAPSAPPNELWAAPGRLPPEEVERLWAEAIAVESRSRRHERTEPERSRVGYLRAASIFERVAIEREMDPDPYWRAARSTWLAGELLPLDDVPGRLERFERATVLASRGIEIDARCAECMLWKFVAMGRVGTTRGIWTAARQAPEMAALLEQGIALQPTHRDGPDNSTLGNLHYASAVFYRILPDWYFVKWVIGVRGDKERALEHARKALALHPSRLDYQIEVATQLLCLGTRTDDAERLREGKAVMREAIARRPANVDEDREISFARIMLREPNRSCGYSGDKLLEMDEEKAGVSAARSRGASIAAQ